MDTEFPANLILNPSHVKVEPVSPGPAQDSLLSIKTEPGLAVKQEEPDHPPLRPLTTPSSSTPAVSLLKPSPTIVITSRPATRLLVPKLPTSSSLKVEETGGRWVGGKAATKIVVGSQQSVKSSSRRAIDSHLISTNTVSGVETFCTFLSYQVQPFPLTVISGVSWLYSVINYLPGCMVTISTVTTTVILPNTPPCPARLCPLLLPLFYGRCIWWLGWRCKAWR